jgi:hypothetical protein
VPRRNGIADLVTQIKSEKQVYTSAPSQARSLVKFPAEPGDFTSSRQVISVGRWGNLIRESGLRKSVMFIYTLSPSASSSGSILSCSSSDDARC